MLLTSRYQHACVLATLLQIHVCADAAERGISCQSSKAEAVGAETTSSWRPPAGERTTDMDTQLAAVAVAMHYHCERGLAERLPNMEVVDEALAAHNKPSSRKS